MFENVGRFPEALTNQLEPVVAISRRRREEREISFCGDEEVGAPSERLYSRQDAEEAFLDGRLVVGLCES